MINQDEDINELETLEDGSVVYGLGKPYTPFKEDKGSFYKNLAGTSLNDDALRRLSSYLIETIEKDKAASEQWFESINYVKKYLGFDIEDLKSTSKRVPESVGNNSTVDTTLGEALFRLYSITRAELLKAQGPTGYIINGETNEELDEKGERVRNFLNNYLTRTDKGYYPDYESFLLHLLFNGGSCRKIYYDKFAKAPISRFIRAEDFIIDADCNSIADSNRITHVLHLSKREILLNQQNGNYRDVDLPYLKNQMMTDNVFEEKKDNVDLSAYDNMRSLFPIYECHVYLSLNDFIKGDSKDDEIPLPFIVILDPNSKEILSIRRNWEEEDPQKKKINYFVLYNCLAGFGIRGIGLAQLIGSNAISLTQILQETITAAKFQNLPGGLRRKGLPQQNNDLTIEPGQFIEVDTAGDELDKAFMPLPFGGPSQSLIGLREGLINQTRQLGATAEMGMMDSKEDIPTGTALAFLESQNRIQSAILKSIHYSFSQELQLIYDIFKKTLGNDFVEYINGEEININDFADEIEIIPVSDPSCNSMIHKIMRAQSILDLALKFPEAHYIPEVLKINYQAQGIDEKEIGKILRPDPEKEKPEEVLPLDPASENLNILAGKPVKAAKYQNQPAHILVHGIFAEREDLTEEQRAVAMAHMQEHKALEYLIYIENILGYELPSLEELQDPEIQNTIALALAKSMGNEPSNEAPAPIDPNQLLMADIKQKEEENAIKERIANLKAETDVFKAQLNFEKEKAKMQSEEDIAQLRSETELLKTR